MFSNTNNEIPQAPLRFAFVPTSGVGTIYKLWAGGRGAATRKLPTPNFKFLLGFRPLNFENTFFKTKIKLQNIFEVHFFAKVTGALPPPPLTKFEGQLPPLPHCSYAYGFYP